MTPRNTTFFAPSRSWVIAAALALILITAVPASATLTKISTIPSEPTICDSVGVVVAGTMPDPCYTVIGASLEGPVPLPTMGPLPSYEIRIRITVQEPNPDIERACPTVLEPYERGFRLGGLGVGSYHVKAVEYLVAWSDSTAPKDSSRLDATFHVNGLSPCPPPPDSAHCYLLDFGPGRVNDVCNGSGRPGGTACLQLNLTNFIPIAGVQTVVEIVDPRLSGPPLPSTLFDVISVEPVDRAAGLQVGWTEEPGRASIILFEPYGQTIDPGRGPIIRICYGIAADAPIGVYQLRLGTTLVADALGNAVPHCTTGVSAMGRICVGERGCDLNSDGASDILDIIQLVRCALHDTDACPGEVAAKADCNGDGTIDVRDVICCVRRILDSDATKSGGDASDDPTGATKVGFQGPVQWLSAVDGKAVVEIEPGPDFGGLQFTVDANGSKARIRGAKLLDPGTGYQLETDLSGSGVALRGMLFALGDQTPARVRLAIELEPATAGVEGGALTLTALKSGTRLAESMPTWTTVREALVPAAPAPAVATVTAVRPNPFQEEAEIGYALPAAAPVQIRVYAPNGRLVKTLVDTEKPAGVHRVRWNGRDEAGRVVGSGIYFLKFSSSGVERTLRLLRLR